MHRTLSSVALVLILGALRFLDGSLQAAEDSSAAAPPEKFSGAAQIDFRGTSTLHDFHGRVMSQPFVLLLSSNMWSAHAEVLAGEMTTFNGGRDRNMWKMLSTNLHRSLSGYISNAARPSAADGNVTLALRIRDREMDLPVTITKWTETPEGIRFHAAWELSLKRFGIKPPSVLGVIRVGDTVCVEAQVAVIQLQPAAGLPETTAAPISKP